MKNIFLISMTILLFNMCKTNDNKVSSLRTLNAPFVINKQINILTNQDVDLAMDNMSPTRNNKLSDNYLRAIYDLDESKFLFKKDKSRRNKIGGFILSDLGVLDRLIRLQIVVMSIPEFDNTFITYHYSKEEVESIMKSYSLIEIPNIGGVELKCFYIKEFSLFLVLDGSEGICYESMNDLLLLDEQMYSS